MDIGTIILSFLLTVFCYMLVPVIFLIVNRGRFDAKRAKKIALWNSIVLGAFFLVLSASFGSAWQAAPAVLYYGINRWILTGKNATPYHWRIEVEALNSDSRDNFTYLNKIGKCEPLFLHLRMTGQNTKASTPINVYYTLPNGYMDVFTVGGEHRSGDCFCCGWPKGIYEDAPDAELGMLKCEFSDNDGNILGTVEVEIVD